MQNTKILKILLVYPLPKENNPVKKHRQQRPTIPPVTIAYLAGYIPSMHNITVIDERVDPIPFNSCCDFVAISATTANVLRAYDIAEFYKKRNIPVIIGGIHAALNQEEVLRHCDSICISEAENLMPKIIQDVQNNCLKRIYSDEFPSLDNIPFARYDLLSLKKYSKPAPFYKKPLIPIFFSRGCPHNCYYCLSPVMYGRKMRFRPVAEFVEEIKYQNAEVYWITDDNLLANPEKASELLEALIPLKKKFLAQFDTRSYLYPELIKLAGKAGLMMAQVGIESFDNNLLKSVNKNQNRIENYEALVKVFQDAGISVQATVMVGFEDDTAEIISGIARNLIKYKFKDAGISMITPYPGTRFFQEMDKKGLILTRDWSQYRRNFPVIVPDSLTYNQYIDLYWNVWKEFFSYKNIIKRMMFKPSKFWLLFFLWSISVKKKIAERINPMTD